MYLFPLPCGSVFEAKVSERWQLHESLGGFLHPGSNFCWIGSVLVFSRFNVVFDKEGITRGNIPHSEMRSQRDIRSITQFAM
jgi:hypothetical protein